MTMMMRKVRIVTWTMMMMMMMLMIMMKMTMLLRIVTLSWAEVHEESSSPFEFWVHSEYLRIVTIRVAQGVVSWLAANEDFFNF